VTRLRRGRLLRTTSAGLATLFVVLTAGAALASFVALGLPGANAQFFNEQPAAANISVGRIFRGTRDTPAFSVTDVSSGSSVDRSSSDAFASDDRYFSTVAWPAAFDSGRYIELDLNAPLPAGLTFSNGQLALRFAGDSGGTTACVYVEIRYASSGALISSHGSSGSPLGCASGTTYTTVTPSLSGLTSPDIANDLRVRIYGRDSATGPIRLDQVVVSGDTPYASFTLYPILTRDVHDGQTDLIRWGLAGS
jgi:hypothetical protein